MKTGTYISGAGHFLLICWALFGGVFKSEPLPIDTATDVSLISPEDFAQLVAQTAENAEEIVPQSVRPPEVPERPVPTPDPVPEPDPAPEPEPTPDPTPEPEPEPVPEPEPALEPEPVPVQPPVEVGSPEAPPSDTPAPEAAPRVADEVVPPPPLEAEIAPEVTEAADAEVESPEPVQEETKPTAPEAATTEIVTEAEKPAAGMTTAVRPMVRPNRPAPKPVETASADPKPEAKPEAQPAEPAAEQTDALAEALAGAVAEALTEQVAPSRAAGPPLTAGEKDGLRVAVQDCWVVDVGSQAANVTVVVSMDMNRDGTVVEGSIQMESSSGGDGAAVETAFQAARRAILRCQRGGYPLPDDKYDHWKQIEMNFDPSQMRLR